MCPFTVRFNTPDLATISWHLDYVRFGFSFRFLAVTAHLRKSFNPSLSNLLLRPELPFSGRISPHASWLRYVLSSGLFTGFPSATRFRLVLGTDLPGADCLYPGILRFSADGNLTRLFVTYACILSTATPSNPHRFTFVSLRYAPLLSISFDIDPWLRYHA